MVLDQAVTMSSHLVEVIEWPEFRFLDVVPGPDVPDAGIPSGWQTYRSGDNPVEVTVVPLDDVARLHAGVSASEKGHLVYPLVSIEASGRHVTHHTQLGQLR